MAARGSAEGPCPPSVRPPHPLSVRRSLGTALRRPHPPTSLRRASSLHLALLRRHPHLHPARPPDRRRRARQQHAVDT
jgi:hypothetical protein